MKPFLTGGSVLTMTDASGEGPSELSTLTLPVT